MGTCVIYNPSAGRGLARRLVERLRLRHAPAWHFVPTTSPGHGAELAARAVGDGYRTLIAAGGDGTVHEVANGVLRAGRPEVVFGVWPAGSANDYAYALNIPAGWPLHMDWQMDLMIKQADVGRVTGGGRDRYFVNGLGL